MNRAFSLGCRLIVLIERFQFALGITMTSPGRQQDSLLELRPRVLPFD